MIYKIIDINIKKRTITMVNGNGRVKCVKKESKFLRHLKEMEAVGIKEIPSICFKDFHSLDNIDILDIDDFYVYDKDKEIVIKDKFSAMKYSLADMKFVNIRRK